MLWSLYWRISISEPRLICTRSRKKSQKIFKKIIFFCMVHNLVCEVRSKFQLIWTSEQLSAKKTNPGSVKMFSVYALFWLDLSFLLRAAQMCKWSKNCNGPQAINVLPCNYFELFLNLLWFFLTGCRWAWASKRHTQILSKYLM